MLASLLILFLGMIGIGTWIEKQIEAGIVRSTGAVTALYVDSFVSPLLQDLGESEELMPGNADALSKLLVDTPLGNQLIAFRIWSRHGRLLYNNFDSASVGRTFPMSEGLLRARLGEVVSQVSTLDDEENPDLAAAYDELLETYSPVWLNGTNRIVAVAEFYQLTDEMNEEITVLKRRSWVVVGGSILVIYLLLAGFVRTASNTISSQQRELEQRMTQLSSLLDRNRILTYRVRRASGSVAQLNESYLRRIGSELHDGPVQNLSLSLLKLDALIGRVEKLQQAQDTGDMVQHLKEIEAPVQDALKEMRSLSSGLSLPQLSELDLAETVIRVVRTHERQTKTEVELYLKAIPDHVALPLKITTYRLIQEALNNAFRHADGAGQKVCVSCENDELHIEVSDTGPGFYLERAEKSEERLGLFGMRERAESLGGQFQIETQIGQGTKMTAVLPCQWDEAGN